MLGGHEAREEGGKRGSVARAARRSVGGGRAAEGRAPSSSPSVAPHKAGLPAGGGAKTVSRGSGQLLGSHETPENGEGTIEFPPEA